MNSNRRLSPRYVLAAGACVSVVIVAINGVPARSLFPQESFTPIDRLLEGIWIHAGVYSKSAGAWYVRRFAPVGPSYHRRGPCTYYGDTLVHVEPWFATTLTAVHRTLAVMVVLAPALSGVVYCLRARRLNPYIACVQCGYSLVGNISGRCPECGTPFARTTPVDSAGRAEP